MNKSIRHREPDAEGVYCNEGLNIALGHCRLSIIDLNDRAKQPMWTANHNQVMVFNGEIYNYKNLRGELSCDFITESDTEVLLKGCSEKGVLDFIKKCNGMFSFCFYDLVSQDIYLCRDRLGIKPLYYYKDREKIIFSLEIKGILNSGLVKAKCNFEGIDSGLLSAFVSKYTFASVNTYTIGFKELNEFTYARMIAEKYNTNHHEILINEKDYLSKIEEVICYKDAPLGVPNEIPLAVMSRKLKEKITVVLSGEGADELLGGYERIFRAPFDYRYSDYGKDVSFYS